MSLKFMSPAISVLMSVYNGEKFLKESINSILNQTFSNFEFIIVNDGSDDSSLDLINDFKKLDTRIKIVNKLRTGLSNSLNHGIKVARGEWIARIDADDFCKTARLEIQYKAATSCFECVLVGSNLVEINEKNKTLKTFYYPREHYKLKKNLITFQKFFAHSCFFFKSRSVKKIGGYSESFEQSGDLDLSLRLSEVGKIICVREPLIYIRKHKNQMSNEENGIKQFVESRAAVISYCLRQKKLEDPADVKFKNKNYYGFFEFVKKEIQFNSFQEYHAYKSKIKFHIHNLSFVNFISCIILLIKKPNFLIIFFHNKFFSKYTNKCLTNKWIKNNPSNM